MDVHRTSAPKVISSCSPGDGEQYRNPLGVWVQGQECPPEICPQKFMFMAFLPERGCSSQTLESPAAKKTQQRSAKPSWRGPRCGFGPDCGLVGRPPPPRTALENPSLKPQLFPPLPLLPSPPPPWLFLRYAPGEGGPGCRGGEVLGRRGWRFQAALGARPTSNMEKKSR